MKATGTHNIMTIGLGEALVGATAVVVTTCTSTSNNGTATFQVGSDAWTATLTADGTELAAGDVIKMLPNDLEDTAGKLGYAASADDTLDMVIDELKGHEAEGKGKTKKAAKLALSMIDKLNIKIIDVKRRKSTKTDDELFKRGNKFVICTQDIELSKRIREFGGKVVYLRQQKYLDMI